LTIDTKIYRQRFGEEEYGGRNELWKVLCDRWFSRFIGPEMTVVDLGAGACEFINNIRCGSKIAIDHNPDVSKFAAAGVRCIVASFQEGLAAVDAASVDCIVASNVFEHLPDHHSLFECLEGGFRVLKPGGTLIVMQPNFRVVKERFYDFADHSLPLTEKGMAEALRSNGFEIAYLKARFIPYTTKSRYPRLPILVRLFLLVPPAHWIMGGQMFIVARKPGA
jgi:SAM-dependent methyltransferase